MEIFKKKVNSVDYTEVLESLIARLDAHNKQIFNLTEGYLNNTKHITASLNEFKQEVIKRRDVDLSPITQSIFEVFQRFEALIGAVNITDNKVSTIDKSLLWLAKDIRESLSKMGERLKNNDARIDKLAERVSGLTTALRLNSQDKTPNGDKLISSCELSTRLENCLKNAYYGDYYTMTLDDLKKVSPSDFLRKPNVGRRTLQELQAVMEAHGLELGSASND